MLTIIGQMESVLKSAIASCPSSLGGCRHHRECDDIGMCVSHGAKEYSYKVSKGRLIRKFSYLYLDIDLVGN